MRIKTGDFSMGLVLLALSGVLYRQSGEIDTTMMYALGPVFFPRLLIGVLAVLSIVLLCQSVKFKAAQAPGAARTPVDGNAIVLRWALVGLTAVYLCLLPLLGYLYATIPFLFAGMSLLGPVRRRNLAIYAVTSVAITLALQFIFATLLKLFLP